MPKWRAWRGPRVGRFGEYDLRGPASGSDPGSLYGIGATLVLLTVLLPHSTKADERGLLAIVANAYAISVVLTVAGDARPAGVGAAGGDRAGAARW